MSLRPNHWTSIPNWIIELNLDPKAFKLYCAYLRNQDYHEAKNDKPYATDEHMVPFCGMTFDQIKKAKKILKDKKLINISYSYENYSIITCNVDYNEWQCEYGTQNSECCIGTGGVLYRHRGCADTARNIIPYNNNTDNNNTEIPTTINFEKIQKQAEKRNKDIEKYKKDLRSKENELEMAPNLIIKNELKRQITTIQNRLGKLDPKLITKEELDKKFIEIPPIILYFKIFTNFKWLSERIKDSKDLRYINAVYKATEMTQKQINYFISILNKSIGVKGIKEIEESITPEDIIKLQKGEM